MRKIKIFSFIGFIILIITICSNLICNNYAKAYSQNTQKVISAMKDIELIADFSLLNKTELDEIISYMETYPENIVPWNYTFVADYIFTIQGNKEKAVLFYFIGLHRLQEDIKMCTSNFTHKLTLIEELKSGAEETMTYVYEETQKDWKFSYKANMNALDWDETHKRFPNPAYACIIADYGPDIRPMSEYENILKNYRKNLRNYKLWKKLVKEAGK